MSNQTQGSMALVGAISGGIGVVAFTALMIVGGYAFSPALFLALGIAVVVAIFLLFAFHRSPKLERPHIAEQKARRQPETADAPTPAEPASSAAPKPAEAAAPSGEHGGTPPPRLDEPREGGADDLKKIKGVGPKIEEMLHGLGVYHFDQIGNWSGEEIAWVDENLEGFRGRVSRDDWVSQARELASGQETDFSKRVKDGEVYH